MCQVSSRSWVNYFFSNHCTYHPRFRLLSKAFNAFIQLIFFKGLVCARHRERCFIYELTLLTNIKRFSWPFVRYFLHLFTFCLPLTKDRKAEHDRPAPAWGIWADMQVS